MFAVIIIINERKKIVKKINRYSVVILIVLIMTMFFVSTKNASVSALGSHGSLEVFFQVLDIVRTQYVERKLDYQKLIHLSETYISHINWQEQKYEIKGINTI